jgi:hypothetical protein
MIFGSMRREFYLEHYDPQRWRLDTPRSESTGMDQET